MRPSSSTGASPISLTSSSPVSQRIRARVTGIFSFFGSAASLSPFSAITREANQEDRYRELAAEANRNMSVKGPQDSRGQYYKMQAEGYTQAAESQKHLAALSRSPENNFRISLEEKITTCEVDLAESCKKAVDGNQSTGAAMALRDRINALDRAARVLVRAREILTDPIFSTHENAQLAAKELEKAADCFIQNPGNVTGLEEAESIARKAENLLAPPKSPKKLFGIRGTPSPGTRYDA
jgi:hypothetical protein